MSSISKNEEDYFADLSADFSEINDEWFLEEHKNEHKINLDIEEPTVKDLIIEEPIEKEPATEGPIAEELNTDEPVEEDSIMEDSVIEDAFIDELGDNLFVNEQDDNFFDKTSEEDELLKLLDSIEKDDVPDYEGSDEFEIDDANTDSIESDDIEADNGMFSDDFNVFGDLDDDLEKELDEGNEEAALENKNDSDDSLDTNTSQAKKSKKNNKKEKKGLFARLFNKNQNEDDEDAAVLTDENDKIIEELENSEKESKKEEKKKKEKKKKEKKPKKPKKPKKVKVKNIEDVDMAPSKPLPKLKVALTIILCISFLVLFFLGTSFIGYFLEINSSKNCYAEGKYTEAYNRLSGVKIKDVDKEYYNQVVVMGKINHVLEAGRNFIDLKKYPEALESLLKGIRIYNEDISTASDLGIELSYSDVYDNIVELLNSVFGISESDANAILELKDDYDYSVKIYEIADKVKWNCEC